MNDKTQCIENDIKYEKKPNIYMILRLFKYVFKTSKGICIAFLSTTVILSFLNPVLAFIWQAYIDEANLFSGNIVTIIKLILLILSYYIIRFILNLLWRYTNNFEEIERLDIVQSNRFQEKLETKLFSKISKLFTEYLEIPLINDIIEQTFSFSGDSMQKNVMIKGYTIISRLISVIFISFSLCIFNPMLCLVVLIAPIPTLYMSFIGTKIVQKFKKDNLNTLRQVNYYENLLTNEATLEISAFNLFDYIYSKWKTLINIYTQKEKNMFFKTCIIDCLNTLISQSVYMVANVFAIILLATGNLSIGELSATISLITFLINDTSALLISLGDFFSQKEECANFFRLLDLKEQEYKGKNIKNINTIDIKGMYYRYPMTKEYVLKDINLTISEGEKIALVGINGAGKTTFVKTLMGMLTPSKGNIYINQCNIEKINYRSWYRAISSVFQNSARFNTFSIEGNIKMGDIATEDVDRMSDALLFSGLFDVNTKEILGKDIGGINISGGEWQKVAIARCYYRNKNFIILDEPTGNLDPLAESDIFKKYLNLSQNKTVLFVTHRISVASLADRILVFSDGKIVEDGNHELLLSKHGVYSRLYETQAKWYQR